MNTKYQQWLECPAGVHYLPGGVTFDVGASCPAAPGTSKNFRDAGVAATGPAIWTIGLLWSPHGNPHTPHIYNRVLVIRRGVTRGQASL